MNKIGIKKIKNLAFRPIINFLFNSSLIMS